MYAIVAGGGKVGYYLAKELVEQGHEVLVIERDSKQSPSSRRTWATS